MLELFSHKVELESRPIRNRSISFFYVGQKILSERIPSRPKSAGMQREGLTKSLVVENFIFEGKYSRALCWALYYVSQAPVEEGELVCRSKKL